MNFLAGLLSSIAIFFGFTDGINLEQETGSNLPASGIEQDIDLETNVHSGLSSESDSVTYDTQNDPINAAQLENTTDTIIIDVDEESTEMSAVGVDVDTTKIADVVTPNIQTMLVAGGCFWCVESDLEKTPGVISAVSGYAGGSTKNPTYENYGQGGHREVVEVTYDANKVSFEDILIVTMKTTDPTDDNGTFKDRGDKYSAAFYYEDDVQKQIIEALLVEVDEFGPYDAPLAIDVEARPDFWPAEDYHQDYYKGILTQLKYQYYRNASGRNDFIDKYWGSNHGPTLPWREEKLSTNIPKSAMWKNYDKPDKATLKLQMEALAFKVTQEEGTERAGSSPLDKIYDDGIYVDVLSGEPLFSSRDKFDSGTGWPSFVRPIEDMAVTEHEDRSLFSTRTEIRSAIADNHLGHVFNDGPKERGGLRYCMNGVALRFIPKEQMEQAGYGDLLEAV
jgi:peptide methionine sulfoxide reductase msrA/msrB